MDFGGATSSVAAAIVAAAILLAVASILFFRTDDGLERPGGEAARAEGSAGPAGMRGTDATSGGGGVSPTEGAANRGYAESGDAEPDGDADDYSHYSPEDRAMMHELQAAYDNDDLAGVLAVAKKAAGSNNRELRAETLGDLDWFGRDALAAMTPFLADSDPDIASSALTFWGNALDDVEDDADKAAFIEMAMTAITDEEALDEISDRIVNLPEKMALQVIVNLVAGGNAKAAAAAKEEYEFITGEEYTTFEAAERYLKGEEEGEYGGEAEEGE